MKKKIALPLMVLAGGSLMLVAMRKSASASPATPSSVPSVTPPSSTPQTQDERYLEALRLTAHLKSVRRYSEDQNFVRAYQEKEGLTADGKYGSATALSIASHGVVPVVPFYWNKTTALSQKAAYKAGIAQYEKQFPSLDWDTAILGDGVHPSVDVSGK